jgi:ribonuclease HI
VRPKLAASIKCGYIQLTFLLIAEVLCDGGTGAVAMHAASIGPRVKWLEEFLLSLSKECCDKVLMILWRIWFVRNEITHNKPMPAVEGSRRFICSYMTSLLNVSSSTMEEIVKGKKPFNPVMVNDQQNKVIDDLSYVRWERPPEGYLKLNVDGSFMESDGTAGVGMILRAHDGTIVFSACKSLKHCSSALEAELYALKEGVALSLIHSEDHFFIESDSAEVVRMLSANVRDRSVLGHIVAEIKTLLDSERVEGVQKIPRAMNVASHVLAGFGRINDLTDVWSGSGPELVLDSLLRDCKTVISS